MKRKLGRRLVLPISDFDRLLALDELLIRQDAIWCAAGYRRARARLDRRKDGTYTARVVWRNAAAIVSTVTCTVVGIILK